MYDTVLVIGKIRVYREVLQVFYFYSRVMFTFIFIFYGGKKREKKIKNGNSFEQPEHGMCEDLTLSRKYQSSS